MGERERERKGWVSNRGGKRDAPFVCALLCCGPPPGMETWTHSTGNVLCLFEWLSFAVHKQEY